MKGLEVTIVVGISRATVSWGRGATGAVGPAGGGEGGDAREKARTRRAIGERGSVGWRRSGVDLCVRSTRGGRGRSGRSSLDAKETVSGLGTGAGRRRRTVLRASALGRVSAPPEVSDSESRKVRFWGVASRRVRHLPFVMMRVGSETGYSWFERLLKMVLGERSSYKKLGDCLVVA